MVLAPKLGFEQKKKDFLLFVVNSWTVKLFFWLVVSKSPSPCSVSYCTSSALTSLATLRFGIKTSEKTPVVTLFIYLFFFIRFWDEPNAFLNSKLMKTLIQEYPNMDAWMFWEVSFWSVKVAINYQFV